MQYIWVPPYGSTVLQFIRVKKKVPLAFATFLKCEVLFVWRTSMTLCMWMATLFIVSGWMQTLFYVRSIIKFSQQIAVLQNCKSFGFAGLIGVGLTISAQRWCLHYTSLRFPSTLWKPHFPVKWLWKIKALTTAWHIMEAVILHQLPGNTLSECAVLC